MLHPSQTCRVAVVAACAWTVLLARPAVAQFDEVGACCIDDDVCDYILSSVCADIGGTFLGGGVPCDAGICAASNIGACCDAFGGCYATYPEACGDSDYQSFQGPGTSCATVECPVTAGACCEEIDPGFYMCDLDIYAGCREYGWYYGDGTDCGEIDCEAPVDVGACCLPDESCSILTAVECAAHGGTYKGDSLLCSEVTCEAPTPTGACCKGWDPCEDDVTEADCAAAGGFYVGDDTTCAGFDCNDVGRCCLSDGGCAMSTLNDCFSVLGGLSWAGGVACAQFGCSPVGACCTPGDCVPRTRGSCEGDPNNSYMGDDTDCAQVDCQACPGLGSCYEANGSPSCDDAACCTSVCAVDASCCSGTWTPACADLAHNLCTVPALAGPIRNPNNCNDYYLLDLAIWPEAEETAVVLGGHLATINDATENEWVRANLANYGSTGRLVWIGFTDEVVEGTFEWVSGQPAGYTNWSAGEPNNIGDEDYATMDPNTGTWNDANKYPLYPPHAAVEIDRGRIPPNCDPAPAVPAVTHMGLMMMVSLLLAAAVIVRRAARPAPCGAAP